MPFSDLMELYSYLDSEYSTRHPIPLHTFVVVSKVTVQELPRIAQARRRNIRVTATESPRLFEITLTLSNRHVSGWLIAQNPYWLFLIRPSESSTDAGKIAEAWISNMFPALSFGRISSDHLLEIIQTIKELEKARVELTSLILRKEGESKFRHPTSKNWESRALFSKENLTAIAHSMNREIDAVRFVLMVDRQTIFEASISRLGHLVFYGGNSSGFSEFLRVAVSRVAEDALDELNGFRGLESRPETDYEVNMLSYQAEEGDTLDQEIDLLKRALIKNATYAVSLEHSGNPWFTLNAVDRGDGSAYELHLFKHRLDIVFLTRAEPESISRLKSIIDGVFPNAKTSALQVK